MPGSTALRGAKIFDGQDFLDDHVVILEGSRITDIVPDDNLKSAVSTIELSGGILAPGFIDVQVNGGGGVMFNEHPTAAGIDQIVNAHLRTGTTGLLPTLISDSKDIQQQGAEAVRAAKGKGNPSVLGVHIEGPFFAPEKRGAHQADMIRPMDSTDLDWLCSLADINTLVTLAPEKVREGHIRQLASAGLKVFAGHTNASYEQVRAAIDEGLAGFTHLFNAMSPLTARAPGTVGAALDSDHTYIGMIVDGHHVHPATVAIAHRAKSSGKMLLVTDAMATVGSDTDSFELYGEAISVRDGCLVNREGVLAGSAIGMIDAIRNTTELVGIPLTECLRMASLYPATLLGLDQKLGCIKSRYRADLVHFDENYEVQQTWVAGESRYKRDGDN